MLFHLVRLQQAAQSSQTLTLRRQTAEVGASSTALSNSFLRWDLNIPGCTLNCLDPQRVPLPKSYLVAAGNQLRFLLTTNSQSYTISHIKNIAARRQARPPRNIDACLGKF